MRTEIVRVVSVTVALAVMPLAGLAGDPWAKEPDSFRGALFLSSEAEVRSKFEVRECSGGKNDEKACLFQFDLAGVPIVGMLTFQRDALVDVSGIFTPDKFSTVANVFRERYDKPGVQSGEELKWTGKLISVEMHSAIPQDRKDVVADIALARYRVMLEIQLAKWSIRMESTLEIYKNNFDKYRYEESKREAEREREKDGAYATSENEKFKAAAYGSFHMTTNAYIADVAKRKSEEKKKGADSL